jgi:hypothetical protein
MFDDPDSLAAGADIAKQSDKFGKLATRLTIEIERFEEWLRGLPHHFPFNLVIEREGKGPARLVWSRGPQCWTFQIHKDRVGKPPIIVQLSKASVGEKVQYAPHLRAWLLAYRDQQAAMIRDAEIALTGENPDGNQ